MTAATTTLGRFSDRDERSELGRAQARAAAAYDVPNAAYMLHGSTGANAVALRAHALAAGRLRVLAVRGVHHSIVNEVIALGGELHFLPGSVDRRFEACLPPAPDEVEAALAAGPPVDLVVVTSPTYEGFHARVAEIAAIARRHGVLLHVDSAWGPLAGHHPTQAPSPVAVGADSASISVHKLGGALSQAALLTWSEERLPADALRLAQYQYCTTSPSYLLAASMDQAIIALTQHGEKAIERAIALRTELLCRLAAALPALEFLEPDRGTLVAHDPLHPIDPTRLTFGLAGYALSGFALAARLRAVNVVVEKAGLQTVTVFVHLGADASMPRRVADAVAEILMPCRRSAEDPRAPLPADPLGGLPATAVVSPARAMRRALRFGRPMPLAEAAGRICGELIEVYPPGIPVGVPGFRLTATAVNYLREVDAAGGQIVTVDPGKIIIIEDEGAARA